VTFPNPGPAINGVPNTSAQMGIKGRPFRGVVNATLTGTVDNWIPIDPTGITVWTPGYSDAVYITLNGANATLNGFSSIGYHQGDRIQLWNLDTVATITIDALQSTSYKQNQFELNSGGPVTLPPTTGAVMSFSGQYWFFS
jgi:hypothetical protein